MIVLDDLTTHPAIGSKVKYAQYPGQHLTIIKRLQLKRLNQIEFWVAVKDYENNIVEIPLKGCEVVSTAPAIKSSGIDLRSAVRVENNKLVVNLDQLPLDMPIPPPITPWTSQKNIKPYERVRKEFIDIETTGLNPDVDRVISVGILDEQGEEWIESNQDEATLLRRTINHLKTTKPEWLIGHNLFNFDLPFIMKRCQLHGIKHPFKQMDKTSRITSASVNGGPITFQQIYWSGVDIIDTFHQVGIYDKSAAVLQSYGLKNAALALGLRDERRVELNHEEIKQHWHSGNWEAIHTYLRYDLEDTQSLADFLVPIVYYQSSIVPGLSMQALAIASPALKWEKILESFYKRIPEPDEKIKYPGGYVFCRPGLYQHAAKIDVSSMYPAIMLRYDIYPRKDTERKFLSVLDYLKTERIRLKQLAKSGDTSAHHQQNALKILINGGYGFLGTCMYPFNDYQAATLVTSYGKKLIKQMMMTVEQHNGTVIECDTDGIIFAHDDPQWLTQQVKAGLPQGIEIDLDWVDQAVYVPKMKNYLIFKSDGSVKRVGEFRKRNRSALERDYPVTYLERYLKTPDLAEEYHQHVCEQLATGTFPLEQLSITRKIGKAEKKLTEFAPTGTIVTYYQGEEIRFHKKTKKPLASHCIPVVDGPYFIEHYLAQVQKWHQHLQQTIQSVHTQSQNSRPVVSTVPVTVST